MKINILGQEYEVLKQSCSENSKLKNANGLCECYDNKIILNSELDEHDDEHYSNFIEFKDKVLRHEIIHAYFHECGATDYCRDEVLVDLLAIQLPKMIKTFKEANCLESERKVIVCGVEV